MSASLPRVDGPGDAELISAVRGGDVDAYGELFARHVEAARRLARQLAGPADADDLVSDAFAKVLTVLQRGGGPDLAFRAYLLTAVRRLHVDRMRSRSRLRPVDDLTPFDPGLPFQDTAVEGFDNAAAARAFASLPERWQMVLWHTEVEQQKPADIAPLLGMSANSVSALAYRAREGLRQAFLSQHAADPDDVDCAWTRDHLGAYIRNGLSRRDAGRVAEHIDRCRACAAVYLELTEVNSGLAGLLAPLLLGSAGLTYLTSSGSGAASGVAGGMAAAKTWVAAHASLTAVGGVAVTATAVLAVYAASHLGGNHSGAVDSSADLNRPPVSATHPHPTSSHSPSGGHHRAAHASHPAHRSGAVRHGPGSTPGSTSTAPAQPVVNSSAPPAGTPTHSPTHAPTHTPSSPPSAPSSGPTTGPTTGPGHHNVTFTSTPPVDPAFGTTYHVTASGGSGGPIGISIDPATTNSACTMLRPHTVLFQHAGKCVIAADVTSKVASGAAATQTIHVHRQGQTITFTSSAPSNAAFDDPSRNTYDVSAAGGGSHNPVTLSVSAKNGACVLSPGGSRVTFQHAGSCVITAHQAGNQDYKGAKAVSQTVDVPQAAQTITFSLPSSAVINHAAPLTATSTSGLPVAYSIDPSSTNNACSLLGNSRVSFDNVGSCVIDADQAGSGDYSAAPTVVQSVDVGPGVDLGVTADLQPGQGNGNQEEIVVTVTGLLPGMQATLSVDSSGHLEQRGGPPCPCTLTGDGTPQSLTFQFNTQTNPTFSAGFTIGPSDNDPYLDNNTATVDYPPPPAQRAFRSGIQR